MPNKTKKEKETTKSGKVAKTGNKDAQETENESWRQKNSSHLPPTTQLIKGKQSSSHSSVRKDKRPGSSRFTLSNNRELQKLPLFKDQLQ